MYAALIFTFASCRTYKMLDGESRAVYLTPDSTVFNDPDFPRPVVSYADLLNVRSNFGNVVELKKGETNTAVIAKPTFFRAYDEFLVYPGESIIISKGKYNDFTFSINGNSRRNSELSFFKVYQQKVQRARLPTFVNYTLDTILDAERKLKIEIAQMEVKSRQLFDSLANAFHVSEKFKKIATDYVENRDLLSLYQLYQIYKDTLKAYDLYQDKCKQVVAQCNAITQRSKFEGLNIEFNEIADQVLPYKVWKISNEAEFRASFDSAKSIFAAVPRDYLLTELMYTAYKKRINVDPGYIVKYEASCSDDSFKKLISDIRSQQEQNDLKAGAVGDNGVVSVDGKTVSSLENILDKHKGKLIVIDFWATWCAPCREEMPHLAKLMQDYKENKVVFLKVSVEKEMQTWRKYLISNNPEISNNYLLVDPEKSSFVKRFEVNTIPRYMLIDKEGQIINAEAPNPSDPKLKALIDKSL